MESSDLNSINDVEVDEASIHLSAEEVTCDKERHFAGTTQEYPIRYPPEFIATKLPTNIGQTTSVDLYQCSMNKIDYGSGSDSAEEEHSPYSSTEKLKYEGFAPTGNLEETLTLREKPTIPPNANDVTRNMRSQCSQINIAQHKSGPLEQEMGDNVATEALVPTSSIRERATYREMSRPNVMPRGEMETPLNDNVTTQGIIDIPDIQGPNNSMSDVNIRLATFSSHATDWPHKNPSPEQTARAGMIFKGVFTIKGKEIYDMVECYKCGKTLYGFTENDDPVEEHKRFYPHCE
ncbi:uncharacterized protein LOC123556245 [Mercenaria mercenaria]|uniref:uncharacterized protein LOC123556245 n=1 Tax=Mercenaria mercenaria TaxID=6596 RepID=UPI001E1DEBBF|nr:uncharacterized protein LOC123556245 [Mercenaria mercenaria]